MDNTGNSTGNHLHLQICLHSLSNATIGSTGTLGSRYTSRNPELWLQPLDYGEIKTGTVIGKVTDENGLAVGDRYIWGLPKPRGSGSGVYEWSRTYAYSWTNPDDILVENWGTTDVTPGTYDLSVRNQEGTFVWEQLVQHTVTAGEITYVGLYPAYIPVWMEGYDGWNSDVIARNDRITKTAQINTTSFEWQHGPVTGQETDMVAPRGTTNVDFPGSCSNCRESAVLVSSEDAPVVVESKKSQDTMATAYIGESAPAKLTYLPSFYHASTISSSYTVHNTAKRSGTITAQYYDRSGNPMGLTVSSLAIGGSQTFDTVPNPNFVDGSVKLTSTEPVAVIANTEWKTGGVPYAASHYNAPTQGRTALYAPSQYRLCTPDLDGNCSLTSTWTLYSAIILNNVTDTSVAVTLRYYRRSDGIQSLTIMDTIPPYSAHGYNTYNGGSIGWSAFRLLGASWDGTVRITTDDQRDAIVGTVNTIWANTSSTGCYTLAGFDDARASVVFPVQAKLAPGGAWQEWSAINVMNLGASTSVNVYYYDTAGNLVFGPVTKNLNQYQAFGLNTRTSAELSGLSSSFTGSVVAQSTSGALIGIGNLVYLDRSAIYDGAAR